MTFIIFMMFIGISHNLISSNYNTYTPLNTRLTSQQHSTPASPVCHAIIVPCAQAAPLYSIEGSPRDISPPLTDRTHKRQNSSSDSLLSNQEPTSPNLTDRTHQRANSNANVLLSNQESESPNQLTRSINHELSHSERPNDSQYYYSEKRSCSCDVKKAIIGTIIGGTTVALATIIAMMVTHPA